MRIIIEPSEDQSCRPAEEQYARVTIEVPNDDVALGDVLEHLVSPALEAYGYAADAIDEALSGKEKKDS